MKKFSFQFLILLALVFSNTSSLYGQAPGLSEFNQASAQIRQQYFSFSDFAMVIGAVSGLLGGLRVYANWQAGRHHIDRQVMGWLFSCIFLNVCGVFLRGLFGL